MRHMRFFFVLFAAVTVFVAGGSAAKADPQTAIETFVKEYKAATNGTDPAAIAALEYRHPKLHEERYADYIRMHEEKELSLKLPADGEYILEEATAKRFADRPQVFNSEYPIQPTHMVTIDHIRTERMHALIELPLVYDEKQDKWFSVVPLPDEALLNIVSPDPRGIIFSPGHQGVIFP